MDTVEIDGIATRFDVIGSGEPLLMYSPGGFDSSLDNWRTFGNYRNLNLLDHLSRRFTCVVFDRRESGLSGGRIERVTWDHYVRQGVGLMDHLGIDRAHLMGACVGCSSIAALAVAHPERARSLVLFSPAGGVGYRMKQHQRLNTHAVFAAEHGMARVAELALETDTGFSVDPRPGPWVTVLRTDRDFAERFAAFDLDRYLTIVAGMTRLMFDRDTVPGAEPEDLLGLDIPAIVVPGQDTSHAPSAARYLEECLRNATYWDVPVKEQTEQTVPPVLMEFLERA